MQITLDSFSRRDWTDAVGAASLPQHWDYGAVAGRLRARVHRAATGQGPVQVIARRLGPLSVGWIGGAPHLTRQTLADLRLALHLTALIHADAPPDAPGRAIGATHTRAVLDLTPDLAILRSALHPKWRNRLCAAERGALRVVCLPGIPDWLAGAEASQRRARGYAALPPRWTAAWTHAAPGGLTTLAAYDGETPVAGVVLLRHGTSATYHLGWTGARGRAACAHNLLMWQAIADLHGQGLCALDLGYCDPVENPGLTRFKSGTGARLTLGAARLTTPLCRPAIPVSLLRNRKDRPCPPPTTP